MKTKVTHTAGPWHLGGLHNNNIFANSLYPRHACTKFIATLDSDVEGDRYGYSEEQIANARLIAAAPEMLEAIKDAVAELSKLPLHHLTGLSLVHGNLLRAAQKAER